MPSKGQVTGATGSATDAAAISAVAATAGSAVSFFGVAAAFGLDGFAFGFEGIATTGALSVLIAARASAMELSASGVPTVALPTDFTPLPGVWAIIATAVEKSAPSGMTGAEATGLLCTAAAIAGRVELDVTIGPLTPKVEQPATDADSKAITSNLDLNKSIDEFVSHGFMQE